MKKAMKKAMKKTMKKTPMTSVYNLLLPMKTTEAGGRMMRAGITKMLQKERW